MGINFMDQYSLLHFSVGVIVRFYHISFTHWFIIHFIFEYIENIPSMTQNIDKIPWWPGGKRSPDSLINSFGDQIFAMLGWIVADKLDIEIK